ncbi:MAG: type II toxin-antitoxin system VapC family toxin [Gemmatimonadetes bacterium]|nr:type II toxin-antitoxin system VapC family toxin [Gemmatimonadota bacterium]
MRHLLDTNAVIHAVRGYPASVRRRMDEHGPSRLCVSAVTVAELRYGAEKSDDPDRRRRLFQAFLTPLEIVPFDEAAGKLHGVLRHQLRHHPIGERDLLIAAIARAGGLTLVTANAREFERVPGLAVEDWSAGVP